MAINVTWDGTTYSIPQSGEFNWSSLTNFLVALGQKAAVAGEMKQEIRKATTSPVTISAASDYAIVTDLTVAGPVTVNLPGGSPGQIFVIVDGKADAATNNITINRAGADTIIGQTSLVLNKNRQVVMLQYNSGDSDWKVINYAIPPGQVRDSDISGVISTAGKVSGSAITSGTIGGSTAINTSGDISTTGVAAISANSASDALRITQTGTGNSLLVEDSANPDSTPFVIDASGSVVVGHTSPIQTLPTFSPKVQVHGTGASASSGVNSTHWDSNTGTRPTVFLNKSLGTSVGSHVAVTSGTVLGDYGASGSDGTKFVSSTLIRSEADATFTTDSAPGRLLFSTTASGSTSSTERMRIDNQGRVGIGTNNPTAKLNVFDNTSQDALRITQTGSGNALVVEDSASPDATPFVINSDGIVLQGLTAPRTNTINNASAALQIEGGTTAQRVVAVIGRGNPSAVTLARQNGTNNGDNTIISSDNSLGTINFGGADGAGLFYAASIVGVSDDVPGVNSMPGRMVFNTTPTGSTTPVERMRIDNQGKVSVSGDITQSGTGAIKVASGTTAQRPGTPTNGMIRYNSDNGAFEGYASNAWAGIGGGGTVDKITQASHGFVSGDVGKAVYLNGAVYALALASAANTAEVVGVISRIIDTNTFEITLSGEITGLTGLTAGGVYFLSATSPGVLTLTETTTVGQVSVPVGIASTTTTLYVAPKRGVVVGGANARTQISLLNNTANQPVQDVSSYDAGELAGWVYIDATTDLRFYVQAQFVRGGDNNYDISYQVSGDTPPAGFLMSITNAGVIQITMPSVTGFSSASINYALNAPAVGTNFPLSVDSASLVNSGINGVTGSNATSSAASGSAKIGECLVVTNQNVTFAFNANEWTNVTNGTLNLTAGIWDVYVQSTFGGTITTAGLIAISQFSGNTTTDHVEGDNVLSYWAAGATQASGSIRYRAVVTSGTLSIYFKIRNPSSQVAAVLRYKFQAIRIA